MIDYSAVKRLAHGIEIGVCVDAQGDVVVGEPCDPLYDVRRGLQLKQ